MLPLLGSTDSVLCGSALEALHELNICHGDVKLDNALVFAENGNSQWRVKLCDFSHAHYVEEGDVEASVDFAIGTRLLCAPELYNSNSSRDGQLDILQAIRTDVFSFGLAVWEILKHGASFFEDHWLDGWSEEHSTTGIEAKEDFLLILEPGRLCELAMASTKNLLNDEDMVRDVFRTVFYNTLSYDPCKRGEMGNSARALRDLLPPE